jgi:hypothetical protein
MRRTATHIISSPNPEQLEMRILANHGKDARFSFLRGRWKCAWIRLKEEEMAKLECSKPNRLRPCQTSSRTALTVTKKMLMNTTWSGLVSSVETRPQGSEAGDVGEEVKAARRLRAKEWAKKRRAEKEAASGVTIRWMQPRPTRTPHLLSPSTALHQECRKMSGRATESLSNVSTTREQTTT